MIQFDEVKMVSEFISIHKKPDHMGIKRLIRYLCSYYYNEYESKDLIEYVDKIKSEMRLFKLSIIEYREFQFSRYINQMCQKMRNGKLSHNLIHCEYIDITEPEIEIIKKGRSEKHQKVLFTLYALAKVIPNPTGWVNRTLTDIFSLANVSMTNKEKRFLINDLYKDGLIELSNSLKLQGYKVQLRSGDIAIHITDMEHFGRQYLHNCKPGWRMCEICKKMVRMNAPNQKYCKSCAKKQNIKNTINNRKLFDSEKTL